jgi:hypothetical protein
VAEKGTDLKGKRLFSPRWFIHESIANIKGMNVNLHRLCPMPIIDEQYPHTVHADLYSFVPHAYTFAFYQAKDISVIQYCFCLAMII